MIYQTGLHVRYADWRFGRWPSPPWRTHTGKRSSTDLSQVIAELHNQVLTCHFSGYWGWVCDHGFLDVDAEVVCRQLEYSTSGATTFNNSRYEQGGGGIWLSEVRCLGYESRLSHCRHAGWGVHDCRRSEYVAVQCGMVRFACVRRCLIGELLGRLGVDMIVVLARKSSFCCYSSKIHAASPRGRLAIEGVTALINQAVGFG